MTPDEPETPDDESSYEDEINTELDDATTGSDLAQLESLLEKAKEYPESGLYDDHLEYEMEELAEQEGRAGELYEPVTPGGHQFEDEDE